MTRGRGPLLEPGLPLFWLLNRKVFPRMQSCQDGAEGRLETVVATCLFVVPFHTYLWQSRSNEGERTCKTLFWNPNIFQTESSKKRSRWQFKSTDSSLVSLRFARERQTEGRTIGQGHTREENSRARPETLTCTLHFLLPETALLPGSEAE